MSRISRVVLVLALAALPAHAVQRTFVASYGNDANTATNCGFTNPCRSFTAALTVTDISGEVVALDAAGYGVVTITKSVTITANPGYYAGISASTGNAVTIATPGINVVLRGLNINGIGGVNGILATNGSKLSIENCVISGFSTAGVNIAAEIRTRIVGTLLRDNNFNALIQGGPVDISTTKVLAGNAGGIYVQAPGGGNLSTVSVTDSVVSDSNMGIVADSALGITRVAVIRTSITGNNASGLSVLSTGGGPAILTASDNLVSFNGVGLSQSGSGAELQSLGNNTVRQNGGATSGTITMVTTQ
jgi:hypothetical protein